MPDLIVDLPVRQDDLRETRWRMSAAGALTRDEVRVRTDRVAVTAKNVS